MWFDLPRQKLALVLWITSTVLILPSVAQVGGVPVANQALKPTLQSLAQAILTADSAPARGGRGKHWSDWYHLDAGKAPTGYTVQTVEFWLTGNHACGAGAECRELVRNDSHVLWEFRLRGRGELAPTSVAHIRVFYRLQQ